MNANVWTYLEEKQLKGPSWYSGCHIFHRNELWSIKQLIHTVCLCRPQRNSWASGTTSPAHCFHHAPNIWCKARTPRAGKDNQRTAEPWKQTWRAVSLNKEILGMSHVVSLQTLTILWQAGDIYGHSEGEPGEWHLLVGKSRFFKE